MIITTKLKPYYKSVTLYTAWLGFILPNKIIQSITVFVGNREALTTGP